MPFSNRPIKLSVRIGVLLGSLCGACGEPAGNLVELDTVSQESKPVPNVEPRLSLAITEQPILEPFSLERVLDQVIATSGVTGQSATELFQQWWDTQNPAPGFGEGPHCDASLNGFPYSCRPAPSGEGSEADCDPFAPDSDCAYMPIGLFMRFDLARRDGAHCGEYRIIFARESGRTETRLRNLVIFEAALLNPQAALGIFGCRSFVSEWADLSTEPDLGKRRDRLEKLYFDGFKQYDPVVHYNHLGDNPLGAGQVRTNQFMQPDGGGVWSLREFQLGKQCEGSSCALQFIPRTVKTNPFAALFDANSSEPLAADLQNAIIGQVASLAAHDVNGISMQTADDFNPGESNANGATANDYVAAFLAAGPGSSFETALAAQLTALGSDLLPEHIVARAQAMSCAGCHRLNDADKLVDIGGGLSWPSSNRFTHVSEKDSDLETENGILRFKISPALESEFLPARKQLLEDYLDDAPLPAVPPELSMSGHTTH